jgi:hypothetical protein
LEVSGFSQYFQKPFRHFAAFWAIEITREFLFVGMPSDDQDGDKRFPLLSDLLPEILGNLIFLDHANLQPNLKKQCMILAPKMKTFNRS